jgi:predicted metal-dependent hydrolase
MDCGSKAPESLSKGVEEFNRGAYYLCHETLEELWRQETKPVRGLYKGILQIGVALYHLQRGNRRGALRLLKSGMDHVRPFAPSCHGINISALLDETETIHRILDSSSLDGPLDERLTPHIRFVR